MWQWVFSIQPQYLFIENKPFIIFTKVNWKAIADKFLLWTGVTSIDLPPHSKKVWFLKLTSKQNLKFEQLGETCGSSSTCLPFWHRVTRLSPPSLSNQTKQGCPHLEMFSYLSFIIYLAMNFVVPIWRCFNICLLSFILQWTLLLTRSQSL